MALPRVVVRDRQVVLLSGFETTHDKKRDNAPDDIVIREEEKLQRSVQKDRDAVAFGYVSGRWIAAA